MESRVIQNERANDVLKRFGKNMYGMPIFRMVWANSVFWYLGGEWRPKYPQNEGCWVVEKLCPPEQYGDKKSWYEADLGPFPEKGEYEFVMAFQDAGQWYEASEHQLQFLCRSIELTAARSSAKRYSDIREEKSLALKEEKRIIGDIVHDAKPAAGAKMPDHIERWDSYPQRSDPPSPVRPATGSYLL